MPRFAIVFLTVFHPLRVIALTLAASSFAAGSAAAREPSEVVGQWDVTRDQDPRPCRITLNSEQSDRGDYFVGIPVMCRRALPVLTKVGRWAMRDATHLALTAPGGRPVLDLVADGNGFSAPGPDGAIYRLVFVPPSGRSATAPDPVVIEAGPPKVIELAANKPAAEDAAPIPKKKVALERPTDLAGRYAVLRDKTHDTGCMLTLDDKTRVKGGERAALAPACRDQGIVVFDPQAWQILNGRLVLTAKAGHVTHLDKQEDGTWLKDPSEGKSLSLKKL